MDNVIKKAMALMNVLPGDIDDYPDSEKKAPSLQYGDEFEHTKPMSFFIS